MKRTIVGIACGVALAAVSAFASSTDGGHAAAAQSPERNAGWTLAQAAPAGRGMLLSATASCGKFPKCQDEACVGGTLVDCKMDRDAGVCKPVPRDVKKSCKAS